MARRKESGNAKRGNPGSAFSFASRVSESRARRREEGPATLREQGGGLLQLRLGRAAQGQGLGAAFALAFERLRRLGETRLETLSAGVTDVCETLGQHALGLTCEHLDRAIELARQAAGGAFAARLHERGELLCSLLRVGGGRALDGPRHLLDLAALHLFEA